MMKSRKPGPRLQMRYDVAVLLFIVVILSRGTSAQAGDTGVLLGVVVDADTSARVKGATVTVRASEPAENPSITTDALGLFTFFDVIAGYLYHDRHEERI